MTFPSRINAFFFARSSASGLGAMRVAWAGVAFIYFLFQWHDVAMFYSDDGLMPRSFLGLVTRDSWYYTLLALAGNPAVVFSAYLLLVASLFLSMVGLMPRLTTILGFVLMCSFHERDMFVLGGGDTVLRLIGFILCVSPGIGALSLSRARARWKLWKGEGLAAKPETMYAWSYRMVLWQAFVIYYTSFWWKMLGTTWKAGTATEIALHHPLFSRWPEFAENFLPLLPFVTYATLAFELLWIIMLLPRQWRPIPVKMALLAAGMLFHLSILVFMDAGSFSLAMMALYCGLLREEDIAWMKRMLNRRKPRIVALYDGQCGLCLRSMFTLSLFDWLKRVTWKDLHDKAVQKKEAADLKPAALKREMHVLIGKDVYKGFFAFRALCGHLPALWILAPFLYLPGVPWIGTRVYAVISARRAVCKHKECML